MWKIQQRIFMQKRSFIEPVEITLGIDPTTNKDDKIQYASILKTIPRVLQYEDVLSHCLNSEMSKNDGRIGIYYESENFKQNKLFNSPENSTETILSHDDFNVVNPCQLFCYWQCSKPISLKAKRYQSSTFLYSSSLNLIREINLSCSKIFSTTTFKIMQTAC